MSKNKTAIAFALFLMFAMVSSLVASPSANAYNEAPTHAFITVSPDPVGVGQTLFVYLGMIEFYPLAQPNAVNVWQNYTLTITKPDGTTETMKHDASPASTWTFQYVPDKAGNYTFKFTFTGERVQGISYYGNVPIDTYYTPSSATTSITVQEAPITALPQNPLPTEYWQRPIEWQNQFWWTISGNWFGDLSMWENTQSVFAAQGYNPDTTAPQTAHIVWAKPLTFGGQIGGQMYSANDLSNYYTGKSYEPFFVPPVIIQGILYYNKPSGIQPYNGVTAVDLRTGQQIWYKDNISHIDFGEVFSHHNPNEVGGIAYLWGASHGTYSLYDATTGNWILDITGVPDGGQWSRVLSPTGELLVYKIQPINSTYGYLTMWNSTLCVGAHGFAANQWEWRPQTGHTISYESGIQFNRTVPIYPQTGKSVSISCVNDGVVLVIGTAPLENWQWEAGYSATTGELLWHENRTLGMIQVLPFSIMDAAVNGIYTEFNKQTCQYYAFNIHTGAKIWGPTAAPNNIAWDTYQRSSVGDGNIFMFQGPERTYAYNATTGDLVWEWSGPPAGLQETAPTYTFEGLYAITTGGGELFLGSSNSHGDQLYRGARLYAINTTTGKTVWDISGFFCGGHAGSYAIADGYLVAYNGYDGQLYTFGRGRSGTTVAASPKVSVNGDSVLVEGSVTDQSPGQTCLGIPAAGTPAIADEYMSPWMEYLYMQQPKPTNATGVKVTVSVLDPNGNTYDVGTTTSDASGMYKLAFTPQVPGLYTVIATFAGSKSYYSSYAETAINVEQAPAATPAPTAPPASLADTYLLPGIIGIIIAIAIVGVVLALMLRKR